MRAAGVRLRRRIGHRGAFLAFLALVDLVYGWYLANPPQGVERTPFYRYLAHIMPLGGWAAFWAVTGAVCAACVVRRRDAFAFGLAAALKVAWAVVNLSAFVTGVMPQGYVGGVVWGAFAATVLVIADWQEQERGA